ncbi:probable ubiquitin-like-specific protease 2B isoform X1 [Lycium barbarum]|uniref:probable ubiquitin-like-specific protease 2B isoform X1 n=1 Tax=Lycium barbarum TaxID=112863 RepID=UPI00293E9BEC|nr:probable ubiquitin-like-specific protease 2B isoform X1 [Lycium barbarum]
MSNSESSAPEIVNHQQADVHAPANQTLKGIHVPEETSSFDGNCSLSKNVPRRQRSKGGLQTSGTYQERINTELPNWSQFRPRSRPLTQKSKATTDTSQSEVIPQQASSCLQLKPRPHSRKRRKSKITDDTTDSEVIPQRVPRCHGQSRRNNTQKGLGSSEFELYLESIWKWHPEDRRNAFTYLDSLWFSLYSERSHKAKVLNWITKKNIFSKKYVFVPIVLWHHWSLLIFCHLGESLQSKARSPCMLLLDSLQTADPVRFEPGIRKFVIDLFKAEHRPETKDQIRKIPLMIPKVPQQRNDEDCGNFVLYYINLFLESAPENFSISEGYPYFMTEDWFTVERLECFFQELQSTAASTANSDACLLADGGDVVCLDHS